MCVYQRRINDHLWNIYCGSGISSSRSHCIVYVDMVIPTRQMRKWDSRQVVCQSSHRSVDRCAHSHTSSPSPGDPHAGVHGVYTWARLLNSRVHLFSMGVVSSQGHVHTFRSCPRLLSVHLSVSPVPGGGHDRGQGQGTRKINMALVFPEARAVLMMGLIERRSVKRILIDLTSLIRICV